MQANDIMIREVITAASGMAISEAAQLLIRHRLRALPVLDGEGHVLGMLTDRQIMGSVLPSLEERREGEGIFQGVKGTVRDIMDRAVMCVKETDPLTRVVRLMLDKDIERLPVVNEGRLTGFLTRGDLIRRLLQEPPSEK